MIFKSQKNKYLSAIIFGVIAFLTGLMFIILFIINAIVERIGEADQSLLFWYLPVLIIGIVASNTRCRVFYMGIYKSAKKRKNFREGNQLLKFAGVTNSLQKFISLQPG